MKDKQNICGATTRKGTPCQRAPVKGRERCKLHGGNQKRGIEHHSYKSGLYSKYAGSDLKSVLDELDEVGSEELINADNELKLLQALIVKSRAIQQGTGDLDDLDTISKVIDRLVKAKQRSQKIMLEAERLIPAGDVQVFLTYIETTLERHTDDSAAIMQELQQFHISDNNT